MSPATKTALRKMVFAACRQLGIDDEDRRDLQVTVCGKRSMSEMDTDDFKAVVDRLKEDGFAPQPKGQHRHPLAPRADLRLIHKLWSELGKAGQLKRPDRNGLNAFIRARFEKTWDGVVPADVDMLRDWKQIDDVIRALKDWGQRADLEFDWDAHVR